MNRRFGHARATRDVAEGVIVRLRFGDLEGIGEGVPRDYVTGESPATAFDALAALDLAPLREVLDAGAWERSVPLLEALDLPARLRQGDRPGLSAACALELAVLDLLGKRLGAPLREAAGALDLPPALLADGRAPHRFSRTLDSSKEPASVFGPGDLAVYAVLKVKVGLGAEVDVARVRAARDVVGPDFTLCVDGNMAWSLDEACRMVDALAPFSIAWFEEPLARGAYPDYATLRRRTGARIMLDESLCGPRDADAALELGACDLFNVRLSKHGGFIAALRLAARAAGHGIGVQLGTHPGAQALLRAAEWQTMHTIGGLVAVEAARSNAWFAEELVAEPLEIDRAARRTRRLDGPGLGVTLIPERLERHTTRTASIEARR